MEKLNITTITGGNLASNLFSKAPNYRIQSAYGNYSVNLFMTIRRNPYDSYLQQYNFITQQMRDNVLIEACEVFIKDERFYVKSKRFYH